MTDSSTSDNANRELVKKAYVNASRMMKELGFGIKSLVEVAVDPQLPFMGYTMPQAMGYKIVVSGGSVGSGMLEGLLVHEMSHIYRMENNHPSHHHVMALDPIEDVDQQQDDPDQPHIPPLPSTEVN